MSRSSQGWTYVSCEDLRDPPVTTRQSRKPSNDDSSTDSKSADTELFASREEKVCHTILAYLLMLCFGFTFTLLPPSLLDFADLLSTTSDNVSTLFMWRGIGSLLGSLLFGKLADIFNVIIIFLPTCILAAGVTAAVPWAPSLLVASILFSLQGFLLAPFSIASHVMLIRYWGERSGSFLQALHLMYPIAALVAPQVVHPFLLPRSYHNSDNSTNFLTNETSDLFPVETSDALYNYSVNMKTNVNSKPVSASLSFTTWQTATAQSKIYIAFAINAALLLTIAIISLGLLCYNKKIMRSKKLIEPSYTTQASLKRQLRQKTLWTLFILYAMFLGALEVSFSSLLFTFVVEYLKWDTFSATLILTLIFASMCFGRLLGIPAAYFLKPRTILAVDHILAFSAVCCLTILLHVHPLVIWISCAVYGFGIGTVFAGTLTWAQKFFHVTGLFTSLYIVGYSAGVLSGPPLVGFLSKKVYPLWYCYCMVTFEGSIVFIFLVLFAITCFTAKRKCKKEEGKACELATMIGADKKYSANPNENVKLA